MFSDMEAFKQELMQDPMRNIKIAPWSARTVLSTNATNKIVDGWFMHVTELEKTTHFAQYTILSNGPK